MTDEEVLELLMMGVYTVDPETGEVTGPKGKPIGVIPDWKGHPFIHLYWRRRARTISLGKVVWMSVTKRVVPAGFDIHHDDKIKSNNSWSNLICLHKEDHRKMHRSDPDEDSIPF